MKVLFISASPLKNEISIGNTFINLFGDMEDVEMASVCTRTGAPDPKVSRCFCITEKMIINNLVKKTPVGVEININRDNDVAQINEKSINFAKKYRFTAFFWLQNLVWKLGNWKSKELENFIKDFDPDVIFTVHSNLVYLNNLILHIKKITGKKLVVYAWDNNYSLKRFMLSPLRWIKHFLDRASMRKVIKKADLFYVISDVQKDDYEKAFKKECKVLTKAADFTGNAPIKKEYNNPLQLVYTGNIGLNRWKSLSHIANVLERINENGIKAQLRIYTGNTITDKISDALNIGDSSFIMGSVSGNEVLKIQREADMLVHIEALDLKNRLYVRQSFSTKIVDYLAAARPILSFGPKDVASIGHFVKNNCAIVADNEKELFEKLLSILDDTDKLNYLSVKAYECGRRWHNKTDVDSMLKNDLEQLLN